MRNLLVAALLLGAFGFEVEAQPLPNPPFTINRKITAAQANRGGRVELDYDFRGLPAETLKVTCFRYRGPLGTEAVKEWLYKQPVGQDRLDFREMPSSQYLFTATLLDAQDQPLPYEFRPVQLEYGGWSGRLRVAEATRAKSQEPEIPFSDARAIATEDADYIFKVTPEALAVPPGRSAPLTATLNDRPIAEQLEWTLQGPGKLTVMENFTARYLAPKDAQEGERATLTVYVARQPQMRQTIQILISREAPTP